MTKEISQTKFCRICKTEKDHDQFYKAKGNRDMLHSYCKKCHNTRKHVGDEAKGVPFAGMPFNPILHTRSYQKARR